MNQVDKWITILIGTGVVIAVAVVLFTTPAPRTIETAMASTVKIMASSGGYGSGVVISEAGLILTNEHVCGEQTEFKIKRSDGQQVNATRLWKTGAEYDLCLIKTHDVEWLPPVKLDWTPAIFATAEVKYGDEVTVTGNPLGLEFVMTRGIVSHPNQTPPYAETTRIQIDAVVASGNSGGPLWNSRYELIGINHAGRTVRGVPMGLNFAIPLSMIREVLAQ